jgi:glyoxylase-like metal-dependent hydrolase (beta-lactamase superfamily II)
MNRLVIALSGACALLACAQSPPESKDAAASGEARAPFLIAGGVEEGRAPDGNIEIFTGPDGLVVIDTGRHPERQQEIIAYARDRGAPIAAIVNTHWHLDHTGGNSELRAAFPGLKIYATRAVEGALEGFLARGRARNIERLNDPAISGAERRDIELDIDAVDHPADLRPDIAVEASTILPVDGRALELHVARHAATEADIWIWDPATRTAIVGDLVTLPAPFFDTGCADGWSAALSEIAAMPLAEIIPGHGPAMSPDDFALYRRAFDNLVACAGDAARADCGDAWAADAAPLLSEADRAAAVFYAGAYVDRLLRDPATVEALCPAARR